MIGSAVSISCIDGSGEDEAKDLSCSGYAFDAEGGKFVDTGNCFPLISVKVCITVTVSPETE